EHRPEAGSPRRDTGAAAGERTLERAGAAQLGARRRAGERGRLARERALARRSPPGELLVDAGALAVGEPREGFGVHVLDRLGRRGADEVAVALDRPLICRRPRARAARNGLRGGGRAAEESIQESHGASGTHATERVWGRLGSGWGAARRRGSRSRRSPVRAPPRPGRGASAPRRPRAVRRPRRRSP